MLGVDLYARYQQVTDWRAVRDAGVRFCIVKGTDGGGRAVVPADAFVRGARSVGVPVGLYHYAQLTPSPEKQADVLHAEATRLGATGLPPVLDLEGPFHTAPLATAVEFGRRFLVRLRTHHARVTLYANTSFLGQLQPDSWGVPGLLIWAANYGVNDGQRHPYAYRGRVDIHQYTDRGRLPGITASGVDLNWALTNILNLEDDVSWTEKLTLPSPGNRDYTEDHTPAEALGDTFYRVADMYPWVKEIAAALPVLLAGTDPQRVAAALAPTVAAAVQAAVDEHDGVDLAPEVRDDLAAAVVRQLGARLAT